MNFSAGAATLDPVGTAEPQLALRAIDVWKQFGGTVALKGVDLTVRRGAIHGLVGRNGAGKSTLVSIIAGVQKADRGTVEFLDLDHTTSRSAAESCAAVYQKPQLFPDMTVAENLFIGREEGTFIQWGARRKRARGLLKDWAVAVNPDSRIVDLRVDERQLVELARAFAAGRRFIILDEPTAALQGPREREELFSHIREFRSRGVTFIYISHQLQEIFGLCDDVTVLKDGETVATRPVVGLTEDSLVGLMVGRVFQAKSAPPPSRSTGESILEVRAVSIEGRLDPTDLALRRGASIGLVGPVGSGAIALAEAIAGVRPFSEGSIEMNGASIPSGRSDLAIANGIAMVSADRHSGGLLPDMSIGQNLSLAALDHLSRGGWVRPARERALAQKFASALMIQASSLRQRISELSGGNQQKVMIGRALACDPSVLILANPTVGIDVAVKQAIYELMGELTRQGMALIVASEDDLADVRSCNEVFVFGHGRVHVVLGEDRSDDDVLAAVEGLSA